MPNISVSFLSVVFAVLALAACQRSTAGVSGSLQSGFENDLIKLSESSNVFDNSREGAKRTEELSNFVAANKDKVVAGWVCTLRPMGLGCAGQANEKVNYLLGIKSGPDRIYDGDTVVFSGRIEIQAIAGGAAVLVSDGKVDKVIPK